MKNRTKGTLMLASAVASMLAASAVAGTAQAAEETGKVKCYGANACKGQGGCAGGGHGCGGKNACKGQGFVEVDSKEACLEMEGGRLTEKK